LGGSGVARVWAKQTLSGTAAGSAVVTYRGSPKVTLSRAGSAVVTRAADAAAK
jgi:hypothetical protein